MNTQPIHSSDMLIARAVAIARDGRKKTVAVAAAQDVDVIDAVAQAEADGFIHGVLAGDVDLVRRLADDNRIDIRALELIDIKNVGEAAGKAASLASQGEADAIMKGFLPTSTLLKTVLDRQYSLRGKNTLSHCAVLEVPGYHKLLNFTDGGMVVKPDQETKFQILENAVLVAKALGLSPVKVAVSGPSRHVNPKNPHTVADCDILMPRVRKELDDVVIDGPLSVDLAMSRHAAEAYEVDSPVAADADIFLVDSIEECNIVCKSLINFADAVFCGVIVGARVPVSLVSRTDTVKNKKASLAIACVLADYYAQNDIWTGKGA